MFLSDKGPVYMYCMLETLDLNAFYISSTPTFYILICIVSSLQILASADGQYPRQMNLLFFEI